MPKGVYSTDTYKKTVGKKVSSGTSMQYSDRIKRGELPAKAHPLLDPKGVNRAGLQIRECLESPEHPDAVAIVAGFDLTGSNAVAAELSQEKLGILYGMLQRKGICVDPQVAVVGYGDATYDKVPLQFSQFESDNAIDAALDVMYMEKGGGGNGGESPALLWYFINNYVVTDAWVKHKKKGYFFMIADEYTHQLTAYQVRKFIGGEIDDSMNEELTTEKLAKQLQEKWHVFILHINNSVAQEQNARENYEALFGAEHVIPLNNPENMIETICVTIGAIEETLTAADAESVLIESGASKEVASVAVTAVSGLFKSNKDSLVEVAAPNLNLA